MANVTPQEQLMLELVNRARMNPAGEAQRYQIDLNEGLAAGTITAASKPVLAMNDLLVMASRTHSTWMLQADVFDHIGQGGSTPGQRMTAAGYAFTGNWTWGENISWTGTVPGPINLSTAIVSQHEGLFRSPGHRTNILGEGFREIGIGQVAGNFLANGTDWSASMVTQGFARSGTNIFLTGAVYNDTTDDDFYGIGEGVGGVTVQANEFSDTSSPAGGYEIGLTAGDKAVTIGAVRLKVIVAANVKLDLVNGTEVWTNASVANVQGAAVIGLLGLEAIGAKADFGNVRIIGNEAGNRLQGAFGQDVLLGRGGADVLLGDYAVVETPNALSVRRLYFATLGRFPDDTGWADWTAQLDSGRTLDSVAQGFVGSPEFQLRYGALDNASFVNRLYQNVLKRAPDADGLAAWTAALNGGRAREQVVTAFSESPEFRTSKDDDLYYYGQVYRLYGATLDRQPESVGLGHWLEQLDNGQTPESIAQGFVGSAEFQQRYGVLDNQAFVDLLYRNVLGRGADAAGLADWTARMTEGLGRPAVVVGFSESQEYQARTSGPFTEYMRFLLRGLGDTLEGGAGDDLLFGGRGPDRFVFRQSEGGSDVIHRFERMDAIELLGFGYQSAAQAQGKLAQVGLDVVFQDQGETITFANATLANVQAAQWLVG